MYLYTNSILNDKSVPHFVPPKTKVYVLTKHNLLIGITQ